jgi:hypothetical protein
MKLALSLLVLALPGFAAEQTMTGQISDSMCAASHDAMASGGKKVDTHECALACVKAGGKFVFVSGGKVYAISNQSLPDLSTHAGHTVKMTGEVSADGKSVTVSKVVM